MKVEVIISGDQNVVEVDGKKYVAVILPAKDCCRACAFHDGTPSWDACDDVPCCPSMRNDKTYVSFKLQE